MNLRACALCTCHYFSLPFHIRTSAFLSASTLCREVTNKWQSSCWASLELAFSFLQIILSLLWRCKTTVNEFYSLGLFGRSLGFPRFTWIRAHLWPWTNVGSPIPSPGAWYRTSLFLEWMCNLLQLICMHCLNSELDEVLKIIYLLHLIGKATGQEHVSD